jgi:hypothetical protein
MASMEDLKKTLDEGINIAREGVTYLAERAEDASRVATLRVRIFSLRRRIEETYAELGEAVYAKVGAKGDVWANPAVKKAVKEIAELEAKVNELFAKLDTLTARATRKEARAHAPGSGRKPADKVEPPTRPRRKKTP